MTKITVRGSSLWTSIRDEWSTFRCLYIYIYKPTKVSLKKKNNKSIGVFTFWTSVLSELVGNLELNWAQKSAVILFFSYFVLLSFILPSRPNGPWFRLKRYFKNHFKQSSEDYFGQFLITLPSTNVNQLFTVLIFSLKIKYPQNNVSKRLSSF